jgi:hypothetical protein
LYVEYLTYAFDWSAFLCRIRICDIFLLLSKVNIIIITAGMNSRGSSPPTVPTAGPLLSSRISRVTLLRRICHVTGLRVISRDYDFEALNPFGIEDIVTFIPLVKTSGMYIYIHYIITCTSMYIYAFRYGIKDFVYIYT